MQKIPILNQTNFRVYWNNTPQPDTITFDLYDAIDRANKVFESGMCCPKNEVFILSSLGTKYTRNQDGTFKQFIY